MKIAICGSTNLDLYPQAIGPAKALGEELARRGHVVITGACGGFPELVVTAAHERGAQTTGYSPSCDQAQHSKELMSVQGLSEIHFLPEHNRSKPIHVRYKLRNIDAIEASDAVIFIAGRTGTLNEFTLAYDFQKPLAALVGTGGIADVLKEITDAMPRKPHPGMWFLTEPKEILDALEAAVLAKK